MDGSQGCIYSINQHYTAISHRVYIQSAARCTESQDVSRARHASEDDDHRTSAESRRSSRQSARQSVEELTAGVVRTYFFKKCLVT